MGTTLAFVQARMGSSRLPGKVLLRIAGKSILERVIWRLRAARTLDDVVVLTTTLEEDDQIAEEAGRIGSAVHRGPELDVLRRFRQAADRFRPEVVVRATADNPLIDIGSVDRIVRAIRSSALDYCSEADLPYGAATEAITAKALQLTDLEAFDPADREHVTLYTKAHPERFRIAYLIPPDSLRRPELRITVDTPHDFLFMEDLLQSIPEAAEPNLLERYLDAAAALTRVKLDAGNGG